MRKSLGVEIWLNKFGCENPTSALTVPKNASSATFEQKPVPLKNQISLLSILGKLFPDSNAFTMANVTALKGKR